VPADADIVAAFLYWQVVSKDSATLGPDSGAVGATFNGFSISSADGPASKVLVRDGTSACWSAGGGTGGGGIIKTYTYRADVRRFLPADASGRLVANGAHVVQVPDSGPSGNGVPIALGASLVVIYRDPRLPLNAVVMYDGGFTIDQSHDVMSQTIRGFYRAADATGKITHIVGSGQANKSENLRLPGKDTLNNATLVNPFSATAGANWDNPTYNLHDVTVAVSGSSGDSVTTSVDHVGFPSFDCLTWGAIIYRTAVVDTDGDGLLDFWEEPGTHSDPNGHALPNLNAMGADPNLKDVFVEIGYMRTDASTAYGGDVKPAHKHMPVAEALKKVGDAYKNQGINVHFDVGSIAAYHGLGAGYEATGEGSGVDEYLVSAGARGGEAINESVTNCPWPKCQFPDYPGTVGWKVGFKFYRDQLLSQHPPALTAEGDDPCAVESVSPGNDDGPGGVCERRFDRNRKDMFRYVLGAHFVGFPKSEFPCLDASGNPVAAGDGGICASGDNPNFHIPKTISGVGDFPGADVLMVLGGFSDVFGRPVGTPFMQGATLMHELGHTFDLSHSGIYRVPRVTPEPNCKPNYLSVMNYLFQLRGLFKNDTVPRMDYSGEVLDPLNENPVVNPFSFATAPGYQTGWYAPKSTFTVGSAATKHCDGTPLTAAEINELAAGNGMVRVDGPGVVGASIDWDLNPSTTTSAQDVNFDGTPSGLNAGSNDWATLRLNQLGTRRNVLGLSVDVGRDGLGTGETLGRDGLGRDGLGRDGLGRDGLGRDGLGRDGLGRDGLGRDGLGRDGLGRDGLGVGEVDDSIAAASGYAPPNQLAAIVRGGTGTTCNPSLPAADCHRVQSSWKVPNVGTVSRYLVQRYRTLDPAQAKTAVGQPVPAVQGTTDYSLADAQELLHATSYTYVIASEFVDNDNNTLTPPPLSSRSVAIEAVNIAPVANNDSYTITQGSPLPVTTSCTAALKGVLCNDTDVDSPSLTAARVVNSGPSSGTLVFNADGSFTYTPVPSFTGVVTFKYVAKDVDPSRTSNEATVTITVTKKSGK
jgi:Bacterial Ig domain